MTRPLEGRSALITGASQGLGLGIARAYVAAGASLFLCARDGDALGRARVELERLVSGGQTIRTRSTNVADEADVRALAADAFRAFPTLDILVNNAGVQGPMGLAEDVDWSDWVQAIAVNLLGSVACCRAVVPHFRSLGSGKIIQLSGGGATAPMPRMSAYAASKAAIVRFVETLAQEVREAKIDVNAVAPGALNTRMLEDVLAAGPDKIGRARYEQAMKQKGEGGASLDRAAALAVFLASRASDGITGKLISAVWDPWADLASFKAELERTDVYTLRRITPKDRGFTWDKS